VTYVIWEAVSLEGDHAVAVLFDASAELAVNLPTQEATWLSRETNEPSALKVGSRSQSVLGKRGDDIRIDWGYFLLASAPSQDLAHRMVTPRSALWEGFAKEGINRGIQLLVPTEGAAGDFTASGEFDFGLVGAKPVSRWLMLAYDDLYSIQYMRKN